MGRSVRAFPVGKAILVSALVCSACEGTAPSAADAPTTSPAAPTDSSAKIDPRLKGGHATEALVLIDDRSMQALSLDGAAMDTGRLEALAAGFDVAKDRILNRMTKNRVVAMNRYSHLPVMHIQVDSDEALA